MARRLLTYQSSHSITQRDSTTNTTSATSAQANVGVAEKGNAEIARGIDKL